MKRHLILTMTLALGIFASSITPSTAQGLNQKNPASKPASPLPNPCGFSALTPKYDSLLQGQIQKGTNKVKLPGLKSPQTLKTLLDYDLLPKIKSEMKDLAKLHPSFVKTGTLKKKTECDQEIPYISIGKAWLAHTVKEIYQLDPEINTLWKPTITAEEPLFIDPFESPLWKPQVLFVGGLHANEANPTEVLVKFYKYLIHEYSKSGPDALVKKIIDNSVIHIIPLVNVDGRRHIELNPDKTPRRKNLKVWWSKYASNDNAIQSIITGTQGVDLNRNFRSDWGLVKKDQDSALPTSKFYQGPEWESEAEVKGIIEFIESRNKYGELKLILDMHDGQGPQLTWNEEAKTDFEKIQSPGDQPHTALLSGLKSNKKEPDLIEKLSEGGIFEKYANETVKYAVGIELSAGIFFDSRESPNDKKTLAQKHFENLKTPLLTLIKAACEPCQK